MFLKGFPVYHGDHVEGGVGSDAEVGSRDVVGHGGRNNHEWNAELLVLLSCLHHLQTSQESLEGGGNVIGVKLGLGQIHVIKVELTSKPPMMTIPWMLNLVMLRLISSMNSCGKDLHKKRHFP